MKSNNQINVPQAKAAMERFKMQAAQRVGVNLDDGHIGHLTFRKVGSVGGRRVKNMKPEQRIFQQNSRISQGQKSIIRYTVALTI